MTIRTVLPPYLLDRIVRHGTSQQRRVALDTLALDQTMRTLRLTRAGRPEEPLAAQPAAPGSPQRLVFDAGNTERLDDARLARSEGDPATGDPAVDEAYDGLGSTYRYFWEVHERNSIDGWGLPLDGYVHYGRDYDNAFWDGQRMVFGDGDGELFNRFTIALDIIGHELTHGVTETTAALEYVAQAGALNESISDVFGSLVKQFTLGQTAADADWLIGAGLLADGVNGVALRSMSAPGTAYDDPVLGKDPQPADMDGYVSTGTDNQGVHINSGIPNRAFHLAATTIGGFAWERAGRIWFAALTGGDLSRRATFAEFAALTTAVAGRLYGDGGPEQAAVRDGWTTVGLPSE